MNEVTTPGRLLFKAAVPEQYKNEVEDLDKKKLYDLLTRIAKDNPDAYVDTLQNIGKISADASTYYGGVSSVSLKDFEPSAELAKLKAAYRVDIEKIIRNPLLNDKQRRKAIIDYILPKMDDVTKAIHNMDPNNAFIRQLKVGAKGSPAQVMQLLFGDMMVVDSKGNPIPIAGLTSYGEGAGSKEYWAGSYGSRMGYSAVQFATADSGYFGKLLTQGAHRVVVTEDDCGSKETGVKYEGSDPHNIGAVLVRPVAGFEAGHVVEKEDLKKLKGKDVYVRSALTCQAAEGICSKCAGHREKGGFPEIGTAVGVTASRAIAEPTTQMALSSKHSGGVAGQDDKKIGGFKEISQFVNVPTNFVGGSVIATRGGPISKIDKAPQGGSYVIIDRESHYVPEGVKLKIKAGDRVEAGDMLSAGVPNPAEIVKYKGIGAGRKYFVDQYTKMLEDNGAGNHRRNIEAIARGLINRVKITNPEGYEGHYMGDIIPYDELVRDYTPRKNYKVKTPISSKGSYLEKPVLHYTIGTKITKNVVKDLSNAGIKSIVVHNDKPLFEPIMTRVMDSSGTDSDWKVRLGGFNLKRTFTDAVTKGSTSKTGDTSYIPSVIEGKTIYENYGDKNG